MSCEPFSVSVTPAEYAALLAKIPALGFTLSGTEASGHGCTFRWSYDPAAAQLTITVIEKPFLASCGDVQVRVTEALRAAIQHGS
jgi:hypothetical protein